MAIEHMLRRILAGLFQSSPSKARNYAGIMSLDI
jgi:hypothetical protein